MNSANRSSTLQPRPPDSSVPLTTQLLCFWNAFQKHSSFSDWRMGATSVRLTGQLNIDLLRRVLESLLQRHELLRTRFVVDDGEPRFSIDPPREFHLKADDLSGYSDAEVQNLVQQFIDERIDLSVGPLFDAKLFKRSEYEHVLIVTVDHWIADGVSLEILNREIWTLYRQGVNGQPLNLPALTVQFGDFAVWERRNFEIWRSKHEGYWTEQLLNTPNVRLPRPTSPTPDTQEIPREMLSFSFGPELSRELREVARRENTLLNFAVLTVYSALLARWCGQSDFVIGYAIHGRHGLPQVQNVIGFFASYLPFRVRIFREDSYLDLLKRISSDMCAASERQGFGGVWKLFPEFDLDLTFNWLATDWKSHYSGVIGEHHNTLRLEEFPTRAISTKMRTAFQPFFQETSEGVTVHLWYRPDIFEASAIQYRLDSLRSLTEDFVLRPSTGRVLE